jgi:succinyl-diaminopimelate desuccinylase
MMSIGARLDADAALGEAFLVEVLSSLVRTRSVNPGTYEVAMAERVRAWLDGLPVQLGVVEFAPGRPSVAVLLEGSGEGPRLVLNGHMDTVPVDDAARWTSDAFDPSVRDGYLYGRGACDMKAGLTVQIAVLHHLVALGRPLRGTLVAQFAAGEECGEPGTLSMLQAGYTGDFGIVTEPTELRVAVAERGLCHYGIRIIGRSIHASRAHLGLNPVPPLRDVLAVVEEYGSVVRTRKHPLLPGGSCTPTVVRAGVKENAVADTCELFLDRRLLPGESVEEELADLRERLGRLGRDHPELEIEITHTGLPFEAAEIPDSSPFAARVAQHAADLTGQSAELWGTPFSSDVRNLVNDAGIEAVTFGPGNVAECHCVDERVALDQLRDAAAVTASVARELLL